MPFRVSFFYQVQQSKLGGWSENFYNSATEMSAVTAPATALASQLLKWKGDGVYSTAIRISDTANFRAVQLLPGAGNLPPATDPNSPDWADYVNTAALLVLNGTGNYTVRQWYRAVSDGDVRAGGLWRPRPDTIRAFNATAALLTSTANGWSVRVQDRGQAKKKITAGTNAGVITVTAHAYSSGNSIRISRARGNNGFNGLWNIVVIDSNTFQLVGYSPPSGTFTYDGNGTSQLQTKLFQGIASVTIARATSHKTGRPFGLLSGRRRAAKKG